MIWQILRGLKVDACAGDAKAKPTALWDEPALAKSKLSSTGSTTSYNNEHPSTDMES